MKVLILAGLSVLIALPVEAGQRHRQNASPESLRAYFRNT